MLGNSKNVHLLLGIAFTSRRNDYQLAHSCIFIRIESSCVGYWLADGWNKYSYCVSWSDHSRLVKCSLNSIEVAVVAVAGQHDFHWLHECSNEISNRTKTVHSFSVQSVVMQSVSRIHAINGYYIERCLSTRYAYALCIENVKFSRLTHHFLTLILMSSSPSSAVTHFSPKTFSLILFARRKYEHRI